MTDNFSIPSFCCLFVSRLIETRNVGFFTFVFSQRYDFCDFDIGCSSVTIPNLALGVGQSFLCRREEVGHVFFINHISKCSGPPPPPPTPLYLFTSPLQKKTNEMAKGSFWKRRFWRKWEINRQCLDKKSNEMITRLFWKWLFWRKWPKWANNCQYLNKKSNEMTKGPFWKWPF